jgi:hypothetical protein
MVSALDGKKIRLQCLSISKYPADLYGLWEWTEKRESHARWLEKRKAKGNKKL